MRFSMPSALILAAALLAAPLQAATLVVANKSDNTVDLIDLATGESRATLPTGHRPHEVAVSADGETAVVANYGDRRPGNSLTVIDLVQATVSRTLDLGEHRRPHGLRWISPRRVVVTAEGSAHLLVVDPFAGEIVQAVETGQRVSHMVAVTPDGRRAFVANIGSGGVTAVDLVKGEKLADIATGAGAEGIAVTPDGAEVWVSNREADTLSVIDARSLEVVATLPAAGFPIRVAITPDGSRVLVSCAESGEVALFDRAARREILRRPLDLTPVAEEAGRLFAGTFGDSPVPVGLVVAPATGPRAGTAWVAATQADFVAALDPATLEVRELLKAGKEPDGMAYSPAGGAKADGR